MPDSVFHFGFALRFRNKREVTAVHEAALRRAGVVDASFSQSEPGMLVANFKRTAASQEAAVRDAAEQLLAAVPDAVLFEIIPVKLDRMTIRRTMVGFSMPWRFIDQGMLELTAGGLAILIGGRLTV